jgi:hypothetical protein
VVQAVDFVSEDPAYAGTMTMTWAVHATDAGTLVEFAADDVPDGMSAEDHSAGMTSSLDNSPAIWAPRSPYSGGRPAGGRWPDRRCL